MPPLKGNKLVDIRAMLRGETDKAYRIYDGKRTEWVPKQFVERHDESTHSVFTMPEWLAQEKGFI